MKRILATLAALALATAGLTACQTPITAAPATEPAPTLEQIGLDLLREQHPVHTAGASDAVLLEVADATCELLDSGGDFEMYMLLTISEGIDAGFAGAMYAFSIFVVCPEHENRIP